MSLVNATNIDDIRIEVLGESRAVRATGGQWVDFRDALFATRNEVRSVLQLLDNLAEVWGDEGVFRRCRDRLRAIAEDCL